MKGKTKTERLPNSEEKASRGKARQGRLSRNDHVHGHIATPSLTFFSRSSIPPSPAILAHLKVKGGGGGEGKEVHRFSWCFFSSILWRATTRQHHAHTQCIGEMNRPREKKRWMRQSRLTCPIIQFPSSRRSTEGNVGFRSGDCTPGIEKEGSGECGHAGKGEEGQCKSARGDQHDSCRSGHDQRRNDHQDRTG